MMHFRQPIYHRYNVKGLQLRIIIGLIILLSSLTSFAEDEILSLDGARIIGNQELPNVLYLIPWKTPKVYNLEKSDDVLTPSPKLKKLDRGSFVRLVNYHQAFKIEAGKAKN
jgi:hypothetical protein